MEKWKDIKGYEGLYQVSTLGNVRNVMTEKTLKHRNNGNGYIRIELWKNHVGTKYYVHRLVADAFIEKPEGCSEVNHKDLNPSNNNVDNLEWVTSSENTMHAIRNNALVAWGNKARAITATRIADGKQLEFETIRQAERCLGTRHITDVLKGKRKQAKGYTFAYKEGGDANVRRFNTKA